MIQLGVRPAPSLVPRHIGVGGTGWGGGGGGGGGGGVAEPSEYLRLGPYWGERE